MTDRTRHRCALRPVLACLLAAAVALTGACDDDSSSGDGGEPAEGEGEGEGTPQTVRGLAAGETDDPVFGVVAVHENGERLAAMVARDEEGRIVDVTGALWVSPDGEEVLVHVQDGRPTQAVVAGHVLLLRELTATTVDVAVVAPDGTVTEVTGVEPGAFLADLGELDGAQKPSTVRSALFGGSWALWRVTRLAGLAAGLVGCIAQAVGAGELLTVGAAACVASAASTAAGLQPEDEALLAATSAVLAAGLCDGSCVLQVLRMVGAVLERARQAHERALAAARELEEGWCTPQCQGKECGGDWCDGECAPGCGPEHACNAAGRCEHVWAGEGEGEGEGPGEGEGEGPAEGEGEGPAEGEGEGEGPAEGEGEGEGEGPAEGEGEGPGEGEGEGEGEGPVPLSRQLVEAPAGEFTMGSPRDEVGRPQWGGGNEEQHQVVITRSFLIRATEVTKGAWEALMGTNASFREEAEDDWPVTQVTWIGAVEFCNALSAAEGLEECYVVDGADVTWPRGLDCLGYRLPTEAEWEYAARAGSLTALHTGNLTNEDGDDPAMDRAGWYVGNARTRPYPVGQKEPNAWGLYDCHGNVWEWTWDWWVRGPLPDATDPTGAESRPEVRSEEATGRVQRGGAFNMGADRARAAYRTFDDTAHGPPLGFRPVRTLPPAD